MEDVRLNVHEYSLKRRFYARLSQVGVRITGAKLERWRDRRIDDLVHIDAATTPALEPWSRDEGVVAAGTEVRNRVAARHLRRHQVLGVVDQASGAPWREAPAEMKDAHG